jgi:hypothetical protein
MRVVSALLGLVVTSTWVVAQDSAATRTFDGEPVGAPPRGFTFAATRQPQPGVWAVRAASDGPHLVHDADSPVQAGVSLAIAPGDALQDVVVAARVKLGGPGAGGLIWRYQDAQNYYAVGLDLSRHELAMYRVVQGNRIRIDREDDLELDAAAWHSLRVIHESGEARVYLSGIRVFEVRDRTFRSGVSGVWAASGTRAAFDDLRIQVHRDRER